MTDETGSGALVFANTPTLVTPVIGAATGTSLVLSSGIMSGGALARQSPIHGYASAGTFQILGRLENDNGGAGTAALGLSASTSSGETRVAKAGIGLTRAGPQGVGTFGLYNRTATDTSDFTASDAVCSWTAANVLALKSSGVQVVGDRNTGWGAAPTATQLKTTFANGGITTFTQVEQRLAAIINALQTHGLIGT